jgi:hypothetical protein
LLQRNVHKRQAHYSASARNGEPLQAGFRQKK